MLEQDIQPIVWTDEMTKDYWVKLEKDIVWRTVNGPVGQFMVWLAEKPVLTPVIAPGVVVGLVAYLAGVPPVESAVAGSVASLGVFAAFMKAA